jgi:hypothetical protein
LRVSTIRWWQRATLRLAFSRFFEPSFFLEWLRWSFANFLRAKRILLGCENFSPSLVVAKLSIPTSIPICLSRRGRVLSSVSQRNETNHWPAAYCETLQEDGCEGRLRDQTTLTGVLIFAR